MSRAPNNLQRPDGPGKNPDPRQVADPDVLVVDLFGREMVINVNNPDELRRLRTLPKIESLDGDTPEAVASYLGQLPSAEAVADSMISKPPSVITRAFFNKLTSADKVWLKAQKIKVEI